MKTCFVTTVPPSERGPDQYGFLISRELLPASLSGPAAVVAAQRDLLVADRRAQWM